MSQLRQSLLQAFTISSKQSWVDELLVPSLPYTARHVCGVNVAFVYACFPLSHVMFTIVFPIVQHGNWHLVRVD